MDLLSSRPLREGSRGGRNEFSWDDVKNDKDRENYLGHSLMAPVGRWQQGRDLTWYAKDRQHTAEEERARRAEEIRKIKEAEEDAFARALGLPVKVGGVEVDQPGKGGVSQEEIRRAVASVRDDVQEPEQGKGVGYGRHDMGSAPGGQWERPDGSRGKGGYEFGRERERERASPPRTCGDSRGVKDRRDVGSGRRYPNSFREQEKHQSRRDRSHSRDRRSGKTRGYEEEKRSSRRHRDERSVSPAHRRRSRTRSRSRHRSRERTRHRGRTRYRDRDDGRQRDNLDREKAGSRRDYDRGGDRVHGWRR